MPPPVPPPVELLCVVFDSGLFPALYKDMTSSTKPKVHNISHCCRRRIESLPLIMCTENLVTFGRVVLRYASGHTDKQTGRQTDTLIIIFRTPIGG